MCADHTLAMQYFEKLFSLLHGRSKEVNRASAMLPGQVR